MLVNNAGIGKLDKMEDLSEEGWDRVVNVNLKGTFLCCQAFGREMIRQRKGNIINISSIAGHQPMFIFNGAYNPTKAGIILLSKTLAMEWARYNIRVNVISPGFLRHP